MTLKIQKKIIAYQVKDKSKPADKADAGEATKPTAEIIRMHEKLERPEGMECLEGATYKIRTPLDDHALYVTINDIVLNMGTEHEQRRPFEIFINSKNMDHFQWIVALTRVMSAVFRKGGDVTFLSEELQAVFDPKGGYFKPGGRFVPSIVADIGAVVEHHLKRIGLLEPDELSEQQQLLLKEKRAEAESRDNAANAANDAEASYPASATLCHKCNTKAMVLLDGCQTCLACGYSKCG
ncbi:MAG: TSCPD domain-containing protein [Wenzhouxiangella sp.]